MKTDKIREAITDLQEQRDLIEHAIQSLQAILVRLNGHTSGQGTIPFSSQPTQRTAEGSYIDITVQLLRAGGRPMHITQILDQVRVLRNDANIKRGSVESSLLRHIEAKGQEARVRKVRSATYALPKTTEPHAAAPPDYLSNS